MISTTRYFDGQSIYIGAISPTAIGKTGFDIPEINFTSPVLDPRIIYNGPPHMYFAQDGTLKMSAANEFPLEYRNGVAVGRHEPEKESTNLMRGNQYESMGPASQSTADWTYGGQVATAADSALGFKEALTNPFGLLTGIFNEQTNAFIAAVQDSGAPTDWEIIRRPATNPAVSLLRWYVARVSSTDYLYGRANAVPVGQLVASVIRKADATNVHSVLAQLEMGTISTSPIVTPLNNSATRAASTLEIKTNNAPRIIIHYSDGTVSPISNPGPIYTFPVSTMNWGARYITKVEFS